MSIRLVSVRKITASKPNSALIAWAYPPPPITDVLSKCNDTDQPAFDEEMMVRCPERVECSAKIAMSVLREISMAMNLLRDRDLARRIFLEADAGRTG